MSNEQFNPYASPAHVPEDFAFSTDAQRAKLREIAEAQVFLMQILLAAIIGGIIARSISGMADGLGLFAAIAIQLVLSALQSFAMFRMGKAVYSTGAAIGLAIITFVPCLGLLFMLIVNQTATKRLNRDGIKVGFMGANLKQFDPK
jgi:hypothetical protein